MTAKGYGEAGLRPQKRIVLMLCGLILAGALSACVSSMESFFDERDQARAANTVEAYEKFIEKHGANEEYVFQVKDMRVELLRLLFDIARKKQTIEAYQAVLDYAEANNLRSTLNRRSESALADLRSKLQSTEDCRATMAAGKAWGFEAFMTKWRRIAAARSSLDTCGSAFEQMIYSRALASNKPKDQSQYQEFVKKYALPTLHVESIWQRHDDLLFDQAIKRNDVHSLRIAVAFIRDPDKKQKALKWLDNLLFEQAVRKNDLDSWALAAAAISDPDKKQAAIKRRFELQRRLEAELLQTVKQSFPDENLDQINTNYSKPETPVVSLPIHLIKGRPAFDTDPVFKTNMTKQVLRQRTLQRGAKFIKSLIDKISASKGRLGIIDIGVRHGAKKGSTEFTKSMLLLKFRFLASKFSEGASPGQVDLQTIQDNWQVIGDNFHRISIN